MDPRFCARVTCDEIDFKLLEVLFKKKDVTYKGCNEMSKGEKNHYHLVLFTDASPNTVRRLIKTIVTGQRGFSLKNWDPSKGKAFYYYIAKGYDVSSKDNRPSLPPVFVGDVSPEEGQEWHDQYWLSKPVQDLKEDKQVNRNTTSFQEMMVRKAVKVIVDAYEKHHGLGVDNGERAALKWFYDEHQGRLNEAVCELMSKVIPEIYYERRKPFHDLVLARTMQQLMALILSTKPRDLQRHLLWVMDRYPEY